MQMTTGALVIRERAIDENDRLLTLLTPGSGVLTAYAKGARKLRGAMTSATELLCYSSFVIGSKGDASFIDKAESEYTFFGLRQDVERLSLASYFCQLCCELVPEQEESDAPLTLMLRALLLLEKGALPLAQLKAVTELRLLSIEGYMPDLTACRSCGAAPEGHMHLLPAEGVLLCADCAAEKPGAVELTPGVYDAMRHIIGSEAGRLFGFRLSESGLAQLAQVCERYLLCRTERMLPALEFYKSICRQNGMGDTRDTRSNT